VELAPDHLRTAARRWEAYAADLVDAGVQLRTTPTGGLGEAAGEAGLLLDAAAETVSRLAAGADRVVDGLLVTLGAVVDADEAVADSWARLLGDGA